MTRIQVTAPHVRHIGMDPDAYALDIVTNWDVLQSVVSVRIAETDILAVSVDFHVRPIAMILAVIEMTVPVLSVNRDGLETNVNVEVIVTTTCVMQKVFVTSVLWVGMAAHVTKDVLQTAMDYVIALQETV